jgi:hypothetical protein
MKKVTLLTTRRPRTNESRYFDVTVLALEAHPLQNNG